MSITPPDFRHEVILRDGEPVWLRPIVPSDKAALVRAMGELSLESRHRRFFSPIHELTDEQLEFFTEIDYVDHFALVALDANERRGLAVARYIRVADEADAAEWAIVVIDDYQGRGLGTIMLRELAAVAAANGVRHFVASVLSDNRPMLDIVHELGGRAHFMGDGVTRVEVELEPQRGDVRDTTAFRMLRRAAAGGRSQAEETRTE